MKDNYSLLEKLLHKFVLKNHIIKSTIYELEKFLYSKKSIDTPKKNIFISGLARSGTTMLLNIFYDSGKFSSLTYRDIPFSLSPNLWKFLSVRTTKRFEQERIHQDGIKINIDSPEAFEEIFWKYLLKDKYIKSNKLIINELEDYHLKEFSLYIKLITFCKKKELYLSKNNNNILRLDQLSKYFQDSIFLLMFRDPINHANSLLKIHNKFSNLNKKNKFIESYMSMLGHHEFGINHKPFYLMNSINYTENSSSKDLGYWLKIWINYYSYVLSSLEKKNIYFLSYEKFCENPDILFKHGKFSDEAFFNSKNLKSRNENLTIDNKELLDKANDVYIKLLNSKCCL